MFSGMSALFRTLMMIFALICGTQVFAQDEQSLSDISVSLITLTVDGTEREGDFQVGEIVTAEFLIRNDGPNPIAVRRIAVLTSGSVSLLDPVEDKTDNDFNDEKDEAAEGFQRFERQGAVWRMLGAGERLDPGEMLRRRVVFKMSGALVPGTSGYLSVSAGTTLLEGESSQPRRTKGIFPLKFRAPELLFSASNQEPVSAVNPPRFVAAITLPGGTFSALSFSLNLPQALTPIMPVDVTAAASVDCKNTVNSSVKDTVIVIDFGACIVDAGAAVKDRTFTIGLNTNLKDADPTSSIEAVREWRQLTAGLSVLNEGVVLARSGWDKVISGPLPFVKMVSPETSPLKPGDMLDMRYMIENRGDRPLISPRITLSNPEAFDCGTVEISSGGTSLTTPCHKGVPIASRIESGEQIEVSLRATLRPDALIDGQTSFTVIMEDKSLGESLFHSMPLRMEGFDNPTISISDTTAAADADITTSIGGSVKVRASGTFPRGRYKGGVRVLARIVDALTGAPIGPAPFQMKSAVVQVADQDAVEYDTESDFDVKTDGLWSTFQMPINLEDKSKFSGVQRQWSASFDLLFPNDPELQQNRVVDISVETLAYETRISSSFDTVQVLIVEPNVVIKLFTLDDDRTLQSGEVLTLVGMACNYGDSDAYDVRLSVNLPERFSRNEQIIQPFLIPLDVVRNGFVAELVAEQRSSVERDVSFEGNIANASLPSDMPLPPESCLGVDIGGTIEPDWTGQTDFAEVALSLAPVASNLSDDARIYPAKTAPALRLQVPAVNLGSPAALKINAAGETEHRLTLEVPAQLGAYTLSLDTSSSSRLLWKILRRATDDTFMPWIDGARIAGGETVSLLLKASTATDLPLGWTDTTSVRAVVLTDDGRSFTARVRLVTTGGAGSNAEISTEKRMAVDRNCNGVLSDETAQDALFESGKDILPGECVVVRIGFSNTGKGQVERIVIRDAVAARTELIAESVNVRIAPEPLGALISPDLPASVLEWQFQGLFRPGAVGEVEYTLRLAPAP